MTLDPLVYVHDCISTNSQHTNEITRTVPRPCILSHLSIDNHMVMYLLIEKQLSSIVHSYMYMKTVTAGYKLARPQFKCYCLIHV